MKLKTIVPLTILFACLVALPKIGLAQAKKPTPAGSTADKPNILVIFGDDIGQTNVSAYSMGTMGYRTPNIDRVAKEGMIFTDYYAEQSCTAGRASFITGQSGLRTGLTKVGLPGAKVGLQKEDPTIDRKRTRLNSSHGYISYAVFCFKKTIRDLEIRQGMPKLHSLGRILCHLLQRALGTAGATRGAGQSASVENVNSDADSATDAAE